MEGTKKQRRELLCRCFRYIQPYKKELAAAAAALLGVTAAGFLQPLVIRKIMDNGMIEKDMAGILFFSCLLGALVAVSQALEFLQTGVFVKIHNASYEAVSRQVFDKVLRLRKDFFTDRKNGEIINCLTLDMMQVTSVSDRYIVMSAGHVFRIVSGSAGLFLISPGLAMVVLAMIPLKYFSVQRLSAQREDNMREDIEANRRFSRWFDDTLDGMEEVHLWNLGSRRKEVFGRLLRELLAVREKGSMTDAKNLFTEMMLSWGVDVVLYILGGTLVCRGDLTVGAVVAFISYSGYVTGPVASLINLKMHFARILPSAERLFSFLDREEEVSGVRELPKGGGAPVLSFDGVRFSYGDGREVLKDVSFRIMPGEKAAFIGENGSGKSTIFNLLLRFYEPCGGEITADGIPVREFPVDEYRGLFSVVSQEPYLFMDSISGNVDLSGEKSEEEIRRALNQSGAAGYIRRFPEGEQTQTGNKGMKLSGGEKQKLAVARALLKNSPVVLLDEASSGYDVESDKYLHHIITCEMEGKTVLMITHHYHQLVGFDRIFYLKDGVLREKGEEEQPDPHC